jgi:hypothetical protein
MITKHPPGPPMDLANMRRQGVHLLFIESSTKIW